MLGTMYSWTSIQLRIKANKFTVTTLNVQTASKSNIKAFKTNFSSLTVVKRYWRQTSSLMKEYSEQLSKNIWTTISVFPNDTMLLFATVFYTISALALCPGFWFLLLLWNELAVGFNFSVNWLVTVWLLRNLFVQNLFNFGMLSVATLNRNVMMVTTFCNKWYLIGSLWPYVNL